MPNRVEKYIEIRLVSKSPTGKTDIYDVINKNHHIICGTIRWHGAFRKYCFYPGNDMLFDWDCLRLIADFCETKTQEHYGRL